LAEFTCDDGTTIDWMQVNNGGSDCMDGEDEANSDGSEKLFTCNDGSTVDWQQLNDYTADCTTAEDEGVQHHYTLQMTLYDESGAPVASTEETICERACDSSQDWASDWSVDTGVSTPSTYGETTMCMTAMFSETGASSPLLELGMMCDSFWVGPDISWISFWPEGLEVYTGVGVSDWEENGGATLTATLFDPSLNVISTDTMAIDGSSDSYTLDESTSVLEEGEYCLTVELLADGESTPYISETSCEMVEANDDAGDVSERVETVFSAIAESGLEDVLE
jgi:hypothetical protein